MPAPLSAAPVRKFALSEDGYRWEGVAPATYKPEGTTFRDVTRQLLFDAADCAGAELRYFEVAPGGHSTLERHVHVHAVLVLRGRGKVLVGEQVYAIEAFDLVYVPAATWHQFRAAPDAPLGFLCLVACDRDRPQRPSPADVAALRALPGVTDFIRT